MAQKRRRCKVKIKIGQLFGSRKVLELKYDATSPGRLMLVQCIRCGDKAWKRVRAKQPDCHCHRMNDLTGKRIGRWTVIKRLNPKAKTTTGYYYRYLAKCDCGETQPVQHSSLQHGTSMGCRYCAGWLLRHPSASVTTLRRLRELRKILGPKRFRRVQIRRQQGMWCWVNRVRLRERWVQWYKINREKVRRKARTPKARKRATELQRHRRERIRNGG